MLEAVAERLTKSVRQSDTVARIGGDEFVVILETAHQISDAEKAARRVHLALEKPFVLEGHEVEGTVSIGFSFYPQNGLDTDTLLRAAWRRRGHLLGDLVTIDKVVRNGSRG